MLLEALSDAYLVPEQSCNNAPTAQRLTGHI